VNSAISATRQTLAVGWLLVQASLRNLRGHWALGIFSLLAAFTIWVVIQDVENPRVEGIAPPDTEQAIQVQFVNSSPDVTVTDIPTVRVRVEAREDRLGDLRAGDFVATIDLQGLEPGETELLLPISVRTNDGDVRVLEVEPAEVLVLLEPVAEEDLPVTIRRTQPLPDGFEEADPPSIDPQFVTVSGPKTLVDNVDRVEVDVNLSGQLADYEVTRELIARNSNGQRQTVTLSATQATVSFSIEQIVKSREFAVNAPVVGLLAPGYRVAHIALDPKFIQVSASEDVLDSITELRLEDLNLEGATDDITQVVRIRPISNAILRPDEVTVFVDIEPIGCDPDDTAETACAGSLFVVAPNFVDLPAGLGVADGIYQVRVMVTGPPLALSTLSLSDVTAQISLAGGVAGTQTYTPTVTAPAGTIARPISQISITLVPQ
jgi:YbbR domain-containing protein